MYVELVAFYAQQGKSRWTAVLRREVNERRGKCRMSKSECRKKPEFRMTKSIRH